MEKAVKISDLLDQARAAEAIILPEDVQARLCTFDVVRLRLLTFRHMIALADYAAYNPVRWRVLKKHYLNPGLKQKEIAASEGIKWTAVRDWINHAPVITDDIWQDVPL